MPSYAAQTDVETVQSQERPRKRRKTSLHEGAPLGEIMLSGLAGGIGGCAAKSSVAPLDRIKILFQAGSPQYKEYAGTFTGVFRAANQIYGETGIRGLFQGHSATLLRIFPYAAIKFMVYDEAHAILMPTPAEETALRSFVAGATAGVSSVALTYPLELIRVRLAYETHRSATDRPSSYSQVLRLVYQEGATPSYRNYFRGFTPTLIGMVPYAGTSFVVWNGLRKASGPGEPSTLTNLACGAAAGALSQTASYPFEVVRRRMQVHPKRFWPTVAALYSQSGLRAFYVGLSIGYLKVIPMTAISFTTWQACKRFFGVAS